MWDELGGRIKRVELNTRVVKKGSGRICLCHATCPSIFKFTMVQRGRFRHWCNARLCRLKDGHRGSALMNQWPWKTIVWALQ